MYLPPQNRLEGWDEVRRFVESARAADLVTVNSEGLPVATLMPMIWQAPDLEQGNYGQLVMHMARANNQWAQIKPGAQGLAIVHGAQAYISPTNYENKKVDHKVVPTWNYQAVHMSGTVEISQDTELLRQIVSDLTRRHETTRTTPWLVEESDSRYFELQLKGIVAVILHVTKVEAKSKLSQNKSVADRERIIADLQNTAIPGEDVIAAEMQRNL